jgi:hypothetical protein
MKTGVSSQKSESKASIPGSGLNIQHCRKNSGSDFIIDFFRPFPLRTLSKTRTPLVTC